LSSHHCVVERRTMTHTNFMLQKQNKVTFVLICLLRFSDSGQKILKFWFWWCWACWLLDDTWSV